MAKVIICDVCNKNGTLVKSTHKLRFKVGGTTFQVDVCLAHKNAMPKDPVEWIIEYYRLLGIKIGETEAKKIIGGET